MDASGEAAQAKIMSLTNVTIDEKLIRNFLEAVMQRPPYIVEFFGKALERHYGPRKLVVNFVELPKWDERTRKVVEPMAGIVAHYPETPALPAPTP